MELWEYSSVDDPCMNKQEYYTNALLPRHTLDIDHVQSSEERDLFPTELEEEDPRY